MKSLFKCFLTAFLLSFSLTGLSSADDTASVETEALEIADRLRCLVCTDENIENAHDETAKDIRFFIRKHLTDGKTQDIVVNLLLAQYGDMITLQDALSPTAKNEKIFCLFSCVFFFSSMIFYIYKRSKNFKL